MRLNSKLRARNEQEKAMLFELDSEQVELFNPLARPVPIFPRTNFPPIALYTIMEADHTI